MNYLSNVVFKTGVEKEPELSIDMTTSIGLTGYRSRVFAKEGTCMLFDMGTEGYHDFWMSQVAFALDVIFIGEDLKVVDIVKGVPLSDKAFTSIKPALYVVETREGWCRDNGVKAGTAVEFYSMWDRLK